jgi:hypothetical protein
MKKHSESLLVESKKLVEAYYIAKGWQKDRWGHLKKVHKGAEMRLHMGAWGARLEVKDDFCGWIGHYERKKYVAMAQQIKDKQL